MPNDIDNIFDEFKPTEQKSASDIDNIFNEFSSPQSAAEVAAERTRKSIKRQSEVSPELRQGLTDIGRGVGHGVGNVGLSVLYGINQLAGTEEEKRKYDKYLQNRAKEYEQQGNAYKAGSLIGETAATGPLAAGPVRAIQATKLLPITKSVLSGATAGGIFGGATTVANPEQSFGENVLEGAKVGAVAGPVADIVGTGAMKLGTAAKRGLQTSIESRKSGLNPGAVKATLQSLQDIGLTPAQAEAEVTRLGPKGTLADIDLALLDEAEMLAKSGGAASSMMKGRFADRADAASNEATNIINRNLGGNPDLDVLKERIIKDAQRATKGDYQIAYTQGGLDVQPILDDINQKLQSAVGAKAQVLKEAKSYLYKTEKDAQGNPIQVLRHSVKDLHESRMALDDVIERRGTPDTSAGKYALNAVKDIRDQIDKQLKSVPEMKSADEKFAEKMDILKGIDIGKKIFDRRINYAQFAKEFNASSAEKKDIIREGIKGQVYNQLEAATRGEASEAQKLFGKSSVNRSKFQLAFGQNADEVLNALEKEATFRGSERTISGGSRTGQIQALQQKYGLREKGPGLATEVAGGVLTDFLHGSYGVATAVRAGHRIGHSTLNRLYNTDKTIAGAADLFSRSGAQLNSALNTLSRVSTVRNRIPTGNVSRRIRKTIGTLPIAIGEEINQGNQ